MANTQEIRNIYIHMYVLFSKKISRGYDNNDESRHEVVANYETCFYLTLELEFASNLLKINIWKRGSIIQT